MTTTLCTSGAVVYHAGKDATVLADAQYTSYINEAEGQLITDTGVNWVDAYSGLNSDFQKVVEGATAALAAVYVINYDPLALGSLTTATTMINVNLDKYDRAVRQLKDTDVQAKLSVSRINT